MNNNEIVNYQPFEAVWSKIGATYYVMINKGTVHSFFKPERAVEVEDMVEIKNEYSEPHELIDGKILYVEVSLTRETYNQGFTVGVPVSASIKIGDELPELDEPPFTMYYEVCKAENSMIRQKLCSDIWAGWKEFEPESSSSESSSSESSPSDSSSSSSSSSSSDPSDSPSDSSSDSPSDSPSDPSSSDDPSSSA